MTTSESGTPVDTADVWRAIGRLEGDTAALLEGQRVLRVDLQTGLVELRTDLKGELKTGLAEVRTELKTGLLEVNRRVDRLFYAILAMGGALFVAIVVSNFTNS